MFSLNALSREIVTGWWESFEDSNKVPRFTSEKESQKRKINMGGETLAK